MTEEEAKVVLDARHRLVSAERYLLRLRSDERPFFVNNLNAALKLIREAESILREQISE